MRRYKEDRVVGPSENFKSALLPGGVSRPANCHEPKFLVQSRRELLGAVSAQSWHVGQQSQGQSRRGVISVRRDKLIDGDLKQAHAR